MFLDFAFSHPESVSGVEILCPCNRCANRWSMERDGVREHLYYFGFMPSYYIWTSHGESSFHSSRSTYDYGTSSSSAPHQENLGFRDVVYDVDGSHFDVPHRSTDYHESTDEQPNPAAQAFYDLLRSEDQELYQGCDYSSPLYTIARLLNIKTSHNVAQTTFDEFVSVMKSALPRDNKLPGSFYDAKKLTKKLGMGVEKIHVCPNECMLFYKETAHLQECIHCHASRYLGSKVVGRRKKSVPAKVLRYFPIIPRLQRLFISRKKRRRLYLKRG